MVTSQPFVQSRNTESKDEDLIIACYLFPVCDDDLWRTRRWPSVRARNPNTVIAVFLL